MKPYKYVAYVFTGDLAWSVSTNIKDRVRAFAQDIGADRYALLHKYDLTITVDVPAGYVRENDGWCKQWRWTDAIPKDFKPEDDGEYAIHRLMEKLAVKVEINS